MKKGIAARWVLVALTWFSAGNSHAAETAVSAQAGDQFFHTRSLGAPYETGIPYALFLAMMERYPTNRLTSVPTSTPRNTASRRAPS